MLTFLSGVFVGVFISALLAMRYIFKLEWEWPA